MIIHIDKQYILPITYGKKHKFKITMFGGIPFPPNIVTLPYVWRKTLVFYRTEKGIVEIKPYADVPEVSLQPMRNTYDYTNTAKTVRVKIGNKWTYQQTT